MTQSTELRTSLGRAWKLKTILFTVALFVLAIWGAYDALKVYPTRGRVHAEFALKHYLSSADEKTESSKSSPGYWPTKSASEMSVADPPEEYARLGKLHDEGVLDRAGREIERTRFEWLQSLSRVRSLAALKRENDAELKRRAAEPTSPPKPTTTLFVDLTKRYDELDQELKNKNQPAPLNYFDIPLQYAFMIAGAVGFIAMVGFTARVRSRVFRYDPNAKRLTLPDGRSFTPADIEIVDKRKWDKFLVFITLKDGSGEIRLDLYRYDPLEAWVLEMEKLAPGYEPVVEEGEAVLCVDVLTGQPLRLIPDAETTLPTNDEAGRETIYPAVKTVAGEWFVVGTPQRAHLRKAADAGTLDKSQLKVDPETFAIRIGEHDPDDIPERDLRPGDDEDEDEAPAPTGE